MGLSIKSNCFPKLHYPTDDCNGGAVCFLGTNFSVSFLIDLVSEQTGQCKFRIYVIIITDSSFAPHGAQGFDSASPSEAPVSVSWIH
jgi:hypothetical protein